MNLELTGSETANQLIRQLVYLRGIARRIVSVRVESRHELQECNHLLERLGMGTPEGARAATIIANLGEVILQAETMEIEIGNYLFHLCAALDQKGCREQILEAINCGRPDRNSERVHMYGHKSLSLIVALNLENSATKDDSITTRPLKWCADMAVMRAMTTSPKLDRMLHEGANEFFGGVFGEYRERPLMERLAGRAV
ncbi:hypothetical protein J2W88_002983 [Acidovorax delafieldii]|uniref:Uncharacterized protein n=1 Tax=Acidovorax delafieldii TaxID=47920 RepID=A0AAJ2F1W1_ACIDE|nr:hypothetical protein [Acidovorax delafieldii]MDR6767702.1 hypothetical protein [Acidovorax delafieldii]MDR6839684.1 hypothetical protein [Acidovorax delafieldii]MDR7368415.1 hypothetical protein [Acidovorax delafieldii]